MLGRMRILYAVTDQTLTEPHGGTIHVMAVTQELARHGHEMHVAYQQSPTQPALPGGAVGHPLPRKHRYLLWTLGSEIQSLLNQVKPDLVIERYYNFAGETLLRASRAGVPTVLEVNSPMIEYPGSWKSRLDPFLLGAMRKRRERMGAAASLIIAPINAIVPEPLRVKTREIEWGADTEIFDPALLPDKALLRMEKGFDPEEVLLLHFGSLRKWHGLVKLLEAFDMARPRFQRPVKLVIIGPTRPIPREKVHFTGPVLHADMPGWLKMCDLAVFPFSPEQHRYLDLGFYWSPLKVFEAMAMELPVLTLQHARLSSILGLDDPAFFYNGDMADLSEKMVALVEQLPEREAAGKQLRERLLSHYSWEAHGNQLHEWLTSYS